jgi:hypothetical protein
VTEFPENIANQHLDGFYFDHESIKYYKDETGIYRINIDKHCQLEAEKRKFWIDKDSGRTFIIEYPSQRMWKYVDNITEAIAQRDLLAMDPANIVAFSCAKKYMEFMSKDAVDGDDAMDQ